MLSSHTQVLLRDVWLPHGTDQRRACWEGSGYALCSGPSNPWHHPQSDTWNARILISSQFYVAGTQRRPGKAEGGGCLQYTAIWSLMTNLGEFVFWDLMGWREPFTEMTDPMRRLVNVWSCYVAIRPCSSFQPPHSLFHTALEPQPHGLSLPIESWAFCSISLEFLGKVAITLWLCSGAFLQEVSEFPLHFFTTSSSSKWALPSLPVWLVLLLWWFSAHYIDTILPHPSQWKPLQSRAFILVSQCQSQCLGCSEN